MMYDYQIRIIVYEIDFVIAMSLLFFNYLKFSYVLNMQKLHQLCLSFRSLVN